MAEWIFTFGSNHLHPVTGESLGRRFVRVKEGDYEKALEVMCDAFGKQWAMSYPTEDEAQVARWGLKELFLCQSLALDSKVMGKPSDLVPCYEIGDIEHRGFWICEGCEQALQIYIGLIPRVKAANKEAWEEVQKKHDGIPTSKDLGEWARGPL